MNFFTLAYAHKWSFCFNHLKELPYHLHNEYTGLHSHWWTARVVLLIISPRPANCHLFHSRHSTRQKVVSHWSFIGSFWFVIFASLWQNVSKERLVYFGLWFERASVKSGGKGTEVLMVMGTCGKDSSYHSRPLGIRCMSEPRPELELPKVYS